MGNPEELTTRRQNKAKTKYDMLGHHNAQTNTINVNKTWSRLQPLEVKHWHTYNYHSASMV